jgi:hypothetical protein
VVSETFGSTGKQIPLKNAIKAAKIAKIRNRNIELILAGGINKKRLIKKESD